MKRKSIRAVVISVVAGAVSVPAVPGVRAVSAQDAGQATYTVRVPNGLAFAEFSAYEGTADMPPQANDAKCGVAGHTIAPAKDYVFTDYGKR